MNDAAGKEGAGAGRGPALRILTVIVLALATALVMAGGLWTAWTRLFSLIPRVIGVPAMLGCLAAPAALVSIIIDVDREDAARRRGKNAK